MCVCVFLIFFFLMPPQQLQLSESVHIPFGAAVALSLEEKGGSAEGHFFHLQGQPAESERGR